MELALRQVAHCGPPKHPEEVSGAHRAAFTFTAISHSADGSNKGRAQVAWIDYSFVVFLMKFYFLGFVALHWLYLCDDGNIYIRVRVRLAPHNISSMIVLFLTSTDKQSRIKGFMVIII